MCRTDLLSIIRSLDTVFTATGICHTDILKYQLLWVQFQDSWWWTVSLSETCRVLYQNKIKLRNSASCWLMLYEYITMHGSQNVNPLNAKLNPICNLLALLGAHPILHVSRIRVKCYPRVTYCKRTLASRKQTSVLLDCKLPLRC
jgi:hypothetical protein